MQHARIITHTCACVRSYATRVLYANIALCDTESPILAQSIYISTLLATVTIVFGFTLRTFNNTVIVIEAVALLGSLTYTCVAMFASKFAVSRAASYIWTCHMAVLLSCASVISCAHSVAVLVVCF